jgi:hypothetical protein
MPKMATAAEEPAEQVERVMLLVRPPAGLLVLLNAIVPILVVDAPQLL